MLIYREGDYNVIHPGVGTVALRLFYVVTHFIYYLTHIGRVASEELDHMIMSCHNSNLVDFTEERISSRNVSRHRRKKDLIVIGLSTP